MKYSALYPVVAGIALGAMLLPGAALAEKKTPFTSKETDTKQDAGLYLTDGKQVCVFDGKSSLVEEASDSRVAGDGWFSVYAVVDLKTGAATFWGQFHIENARGAWDGYWTGNERQDGLVATLRGSGEYEGLVSRWTSTSHGGGIVNWSGYIVENGPGDVPFKMSGLRTEQLEIIQGMVLDPMTMQPTGEFGALGKGTLVAGGGQASHIGIFTDLKEIGLMDLTSGKSWGMGIAEAANGDLFTWVSCGGMNSDGAFEFQIFFAGGTGRFEHAVGSVAGQLDWTTYTYKGTGTIRY